MDDITITKKWWREEITHRNQKLKGPVNILWKILFLIFLIAFFIFSVYYIGFGFSNNGLVILKNNLRSFFNASSFSKLFNENLFILSLRFLWESIKIIFLGTALGIILAFLSAYFSNYKMNSKYVVIPVKITIIFLRLIPEVFFIYLFKISFDKSLAIMLIFVWFTWIWVHEYFSQAIENSNFSMFYHLTKNKSSKFKAFWIEIMPQVKIKLLNYIFLAFESNLRWSSILFEFSFLGIGYLIYPNTRNIEYSELMIPLIVLILFLFLLEIINFSLKRFFLVSKTQPVNLKKYAIEQNSKKIIITLLIIAAITIIGFGVASLVNEKAYLGSGASYINNFFRPNWENVSWGFSGGVAHMILQLAALAFVSLVLIYGIAYLKMFFMTKQLFGNKTSITFRLTNSAIRAIPTISWFLIISSLFINSYAPFVIAFAIHGASSMARNLESSIRKIDQSKIDNLRIRGYNKIKIFNNFILPSIKLDFITFFSFELEKTIRNFITYGLYGASLLGEATQLSRVKEINDIAPYLWIGFIIIALINLVAYLIRIKFKNNYHHLFLKKLLT
ncbi:ABC transporter permease subunit [Mycoplasma phocoeninasale]|uniref:ABC transporter permease subunit n=1 Tax=Mycoplasma phocoeninasale TaxID=2726117 RepID=A0A858U1I3_9MOLU|nr:ABC transporter permease subunit [Mycoplasma phocoeninasale]MBN0970582.1 ABC transporter permease subunit [Mycoplasma phocoeninasale]QJG66300.1 ABC transporter permease subunit [Mycoplasma phocoeninasale]